MYWLRSHNQDFTMLWSILPHCFSFSVTLQPPGKRFYPITLTLLISFSTQSLSLYHVTEGRFNFYFLRLLLDLPRAQREIMWMFMLSVANPQSPGSYCQPSDNFSMKRKTFGGWGFFKTCERDWIKEHGEAKAVRGVDMGRVVWIYFVTI